MTVTDVQRETGRIVACRRRVFAICSQFGLSRADRLELAEVMFDRNVGSYSELGPIEITRLRDALEGAAIICMFQAQKRAGERPR